MGERDKTRDELLSELRAARERIAALEALAHPGPRALRDSEERFRTLVENSPDIILTIDRAGTIRFINRTLPEYRVEDVIGTSVFDYVGQADREAYAEAFQRVFETGEATSLELSEPSGTWWFTRIVPLVHGGQFEQVLVIAGDITESKRSEEALRQSEERFRLLADTTTAAIFIFQGERMVYANAAAEGVTGYRVDELVRMNFWEVIHPEERDAIRERGLARQAGADIPRRAEVRLITKSGEMKWVDYMGSLFDYGGRPAVLGTAVDITERKRAEEERRLLETKVQHAQKLESLGVLAGGIAHDFNNLLTGILGSASLAAAKIPGDSPATEQLLRIQKAAEKAAELTNQMLAYSGRGQFVMASIDLNEVVSEVTPLLRSSLPKHAELDIELTGDLPPVFADRAQIQQIVVNLVTNASEAIEGAGVVSVRTEAVRDEGERPDGHGARVLLEVGDTGSGMDEQTQARIFDPFFTTKFTGRGLGLAAVQGIVRAHGGTIGVESAPKRGTRVRVLFPASVPESDAGGPERHRQRHLRGGTILVIDDEESVRSVARVSLEESGFEVLTAEDGQAALALFDEKGNEIDAVLLDVSMPHLSGEKTLEALRERRPELPVVLTSGYSEQEIASRFRKTKQALFVQKPFRVAELIVRMQEALALAPRR